MSEAERLERVMEQRWLAVAKADRLRMTWHQIQRAYDDYMAALSAYLAAPRDRKFAS